MIAMPGCLKQDRAPAGGRDEHAVSSVGIL